MQARQISLKVKRKKCLTTFAIDVLSILLLISILAITYYPISKARALWKISITINVILLFIILRIRIFKCFGYPLKDMKAIGFCCLMTRIRMKLADYTCFFYIFFAELIYSALIIRKQYKVIEEKRVFCSIAIINGLYLLLWIFCTSNKSFKQFPKEQRKHVHNNSALMDEMHQNQDDLEEQNNASYRSPRERITEKLTLSEAEEKVKMMNVVEPNQLREKEDFFNLGNDNEQTAQEEQEENLCSICLENFKNQPIPSQNQGIIEDTTKTQNPIVHKQRLRRIRALINRLHHVRRQGSNKNLIRAFPECEHLFHEDCLIKWIEQSVSCPVCRRIPESEEDESVDDDIDNLLFSSNKQSPKKNVDQKQK